MNSDKFGNFLYIGIIVFNLLLAASACGQTSEAQMTGGAYSMTKTVLAGGGRDAQNMPVSASATTGQAVAGKTSTGGQFSLYSGFWTPEALAPTAATVTVGGCVLTALGTGIRNVVITVTFQSGETRSVKSGALGYYKFDDVPVGETYVFQVIAKKYIFPQPVVVRNILEATNDVDFVAAPD
jgi:hypothetical protein